MSGYPQRQKFFSQKFIRLLAKCCAAQDIGSDGCWLLSIIVGLEDAKRYEAPVTFFNEQLFPLLGCRGKKPLVKARTNAVHHGWLHYEEGTKGIPGKYWVTVPERFRLIDDSPCDSADVLVPDGTKMSSIPVPNGTSNDVLGVPNGDGNGTATGPHSYPIPNPKKKSRALRFDDTDMAFAKRMFSKIRDVAPKTKEPNLEQWADTIRLIRTKDGHNLEEILAVFDWANQDDFWQTNILSPGAMRGRTRDGADKFAKLHAEMVKSIEHGDPSDDIPIRQPKRRKRGPA